jgi:hypothetical protein
LTRLLVISVAQMICVAANADVDTIIGAKRLNDFRISRERSEKSRIAERVCRHQLRLNLAPVACPRTVVEKSCDGGLRAWPIAALKAAINRKDLRADCRKKLAEELDLKLYQADDAGDLGLSLEDPYEDESNNSVFRDDL